MKKLLVLLAWLTSVAAIAQSAWTPGNTMSYKRLGGVTITEDGRHIAFTVSDPRMTSDQSDFLTLSG